MRRFRRSLRCARPPSSSPICTDAEPQGIRRLRIKFIRKLGRARTRVSLNIVKKRDIIADYSDPGSQVCTRLRLALQLDVSFILERQVYASQTRLGRRVDKDARK
jgi:hypothetical protein